MLSRLICNGDFENWFIQGVYFCINVWYNNLDWNLFLTWELIKTGPFFIWEVLEEHKTFTMECGGIVVDLSVVTGLFKVNVQT